MENELLTSKILAEHKALLALRFDSPELIQDKLKLIDEHIQQLGKSGPDHHQAYEQAASLMQSALSGEYVTFRAALNSDDKEQALVQLKHKVAEVCQLIRAV